MSLKLSTLAINGDAESAGVWVEFAEGCDLRIARLNNPGWEAFIAKEAERRRRWRSRDETKSIEIKAYARHILKDWRGLIDDDGTEIPYSVETAKQILTDYPDLREFVILVAQDNDRFRTEAREDAEGN